MLEATSECNISALSSVSFYQNSWTEITKGNIEMDDKADILYTAFHVAYANVLIAFTLKHLSCDEFIYYFTIAHKVAPRDPTYH